MDYRRWPRTHLFYTVLMISILTFSCTKSLHQLVEERESYSIQDYNWFYERLGDVETLELDIDEAIALALNYNLNLRALQADLRIQGDAIPTEFIKMLPDLAYNSYNALRSNLLISGSESVIPNIPPAPPSFSSLRTTNTWTWELSWNLLNAGIQYFSVKEAKYNLISKEFSYLRAAQDLIREVTAAYWLVATMQSNAIKLTELTEISQSLAERLKSKVADGSLSLQQATEVIGRIYYQQIQAKQYLRSYQEGKESIKLLLGIPPNVELVFKVPDVTLIPGPLPPPEELHILALNNRPDLYGLDAELALHEAEYKQAILQMFPELTIFADLSYDANPFLQFNYWNAIGFRVLHHLLSIPTSFYNQKTAKDRMWLSATQRVLLSLSVLSQIHVAYSLYRDARDRFLDAHIYWVAKKNSYDLALAKKNLNAIADLDYVFPLSDLAYADAQRNLFYVEMMGYLEQINDSIGIPRYFTEKYNVEPLAVEEKKR